ncbi:hypothetical protein [Glaciihabitans sp. GrIS 2.15]|uniref:hypothetical protein n=1 Tax=Glaciihabitans sp. GrIS 2.15 TaxID=3071710 RepID=UPI002E0665F3|nr:hypothetical protein [Glaciihabitans sp. GrIS 2.15]
MATKRTPMMWRDVHDKFTPSPKCSLVPFALEALPLHNRALHDHQHVVDHASLDDGSFSPDRFRRFAPVGKRRKEQVRPVQKVPFSDTESILIIPGIGAILLTDTGQELTLHAVAPDHSTLDFIRKGIANEITSVVPETTQGHRLELEWNYPEHIPLPFR